MGSSFMALIAKEKVKSHKTQKHIAPFKPTVLPRAEKASQSMHRKNTRQRSKPPRKSAGPD